MLHWGYCMGLQVSAAEGSQISKTWRSKGQDNCDRFLSPALRQCLVAESTDCGTELNAPTTDIFGGEQGWLITVQPHESNLLKCALVRNINLSVYIWRKRSAAGSPSVTEKLFEASAFDVCPTTQHDLLLWAVGADGLVTNNILCSILPSYFPPYLS